MQFPCKKTCRERALPGCRADCQKLQAWKDLQNLERKEKERERLKEDQAAFHQMMGYSADVAYGRKKTPGKE